MQKIFEEYGGVLHIVVAIIALVVICGIVLGTNGGMIKASLNNVVDSLSEEEEGNIVTETSSNYITKFMTEEGDYAGEYLLADISDTVEEIVFHKSYSGLEIVEDYRDVEPDNGKAVDVSQDGSGSVVAYLTQNGDSEVLHIAGKDGVIMAGPSLDGAFSNFPDLERIKFNGCLNTSNTTSMMGLFVYCESLRSVDLSGFDTSNVTNMSLMFWECGSLRSVNTKNFDTSKVKYTVEMFGCCYSLSHLDVSHFDTSNLEIADEMFYGCSALETLDLSNFKTPVLQSAGCMFQSCDNLKTLDISGFDMTNVENTDRMFEGCGAMESILVGEGWNNLSASANTSDMFKNCGVSEVTVKAA